MNERTFHDVFKEGKAVIWELQVTYEISVL